MVPYISTIALPSSFNIPSFGDRNSKLSPKEGMLKEEGRAWSHTLVQSLLPPPLTFLLSEIEVRSFSENNLRKKGC